MNVLVVGGTRYVGYELTWRLVLSGHQVTLLNRGRTADPFGHRVTRFRGDRRTDFARLVAGRRFDAAVDFAAYEAGDVQAAIDSLDAGHYVFISTGQTYLVRAGCPLPARESDYDGPVTTRPDDPRDHWDWEYGVGKRACEDALQAAWDEKGFPGTRVRIPIVNGERDPTRRLEEYLWRVLDGGPVLLPDGGASVLRHVYAGDVVRFLLRVLGDAATHGQAYNVCQDEMPTLRALVGLMAELMDARPLLVDVAASAIEAAGLDLRAVSPFTTRWTSRLDPTKAREELGFRPRPLRDALDVIVRSFLARLPFDPPEGYAGREIERRLANGGG